MNQADREFVQWVTRRYREAAGTVFDLTGQWPSFEELEALRDEDATPY